ncbi:MAG: T9SS type A sorting domain-containing protein [Flavobacteriales bacterium]
MQKRLLVALLMPVSAWAQPVLTSADMAVGGTTYPFVNTAVTDAEAVAVAGPNVTWDFSNLTPGMDAPVTPSPISAASFTAQLVFNSPFNRAYKSSYLLPTELPDFGDLGLPIPLDGFNSFYKTSGNAYAICGIGLSASGFDLPVEYSDVDELLPLPCSFGSTLSSTGAFDLQIEGVFGYSSTLSRDIEADGWGTLLLPDGAHTVLRVRTQISGTDVFDIPQIGFPIEVPRSETIYQWWGDNQGFPLLEVTTLFGFPVTARYQVIPPANAVAECLSTPAILLVPNPVTSGADCLLMGIPHDAEWSLLETTGRTITSGRGTTLPTSSLASGVYVLRSATYTTRLVIR